MRRWPLLFLIAIIAIIYFSQSPFFRAPSAPYSDRVAVLMYHHISDAVKTSNTITPRLFEQQLTALMIHGYQFISMSEFREYLNGAPVPDNAVLVTFDDGYESYYTEAYPILTQLGIPAVNGLITAYLDRNTAHDTLRYLARDQVRTMANDPLSFDFVCHSNAQHHLDRRGRAYLTIRLMLEGHRETDEQYQQRVIQDTQTCLSKINELYAGPHDFYTYPYGAYSHELVDILNHLGIAYAFTVNQGIADRTDHAFEIPRVNAGNPNIDPLKLISIIEQLK